MSTRDSDTEMVSRSSISAKRPGIAQGGSVCSLTEEDIKTFIRVKTLDVISFGKYRRHLLKQKDNCEAWAIEMHDRFSRVSAEVKLMCKQHHIFKTYGHTSVFSVCCKILTSTEMPLLLRDGSVHRCAISHVTIYNGVKIKLEGSIDDNRQGQNYIVVHEKFYKFCLSFWFFTRFEHICRAHIRERFPKEQCTPSNWTKFNEELSKESKFKTQLARSFLSSVHYSQSVMNSVVSRKRKRDIESFTFLPR